MSKNGESPIICELKHFHDLPTILFISRAGFLAYYHRDNFGWLCMVVALHVVSKHMVLNLMAV
jgi:hypothetical protein